MHQRIASAAGAAALPGVLARFKLRWLIYGAAVYYGLRYMSKRGIFPEQANAALNLIDHGIDAAKSKIGLGESAHPQVVHH